MTEACLKQIRYWNRALKESQKGHRRKNRLISRLRNRISDLEAENRRMMLSVAEKDAEIESLRRLLMNIARWCVPGTMDRWNTNDVRSAAREAIWPPEELK